MAVRGYWQLDGLEDYLDKIQQAGRDVDLAAAECVEAADDILLEAMVERVPVGDPAEDPHPGALKEFLAQQGKGPVVHDGNLTIGEVGLRTFGPSDMPATPYARLQYYRKNPRRSRPRIWKGRFFYGLYLEFGTAKMAARPWFRPAVDENRARIKALWRAIFQRWGLAD